MIDFERETLIPVREVPKTVPSRPSLRTVFRWVLDGYGPEKILLESVKLGNERWTSKEAVQRFIVAINGRKHRRRRPARRNQIAAAEQRLARDGI